MKINPLDPRYLKGFNDGFTSGKKTAIERIVVGFEKLKNEKGIGEKTLRKVAEAMTLPLEED